jgi:hypothetical protein
VLLKQVLYHMSYTSSPFISNVYKFRKLQIIKDHIVFFTSLPPYLLFALILLGMSGGSGFSYANPLKILSISEI